MEEASFQTHVQNGCEPDTDEINRCVTCGADLGRDNFRQYCAKPIVCLNV